MNSKPVKDAMRLAQELHDKKLELSLVKKQLKAIQKYVAELESPKTCEGCKHENFRTTATECSDCSRIYGCDYYEPKDKE